MRFNVPITITKAGDPVTPHLVSVHLGGSSNVDVLGYQKSDGSIVLFKMGGAAVILDQSGKIIFGVDYSDSSCFFGNDSEQAYEEFADQYEWMVPSLALGHNSVRGFALNDFYIADPDTGDNLLIAYDVLMDMGEGNIALPLDIFIPEIEVDIDNAFVTTCEVDGREFLAISLNGIVRPILDVGGNRGCPVTAEGGTFNVTDCEHVGAAGVGMTDLPLQVALGSSWATRACSVSSENINAFLMISVYMLGYELLLNTVTLTKPAGTWYIPTSQFIVYEA